MVAGAVGASAVLASAPSMGSPTALSSYGTIVLATTFSPAGYQFTNLYIFSTVGPFYVQMINLEVASAASPTPTTINSIDLAYIYYDAGSLTFNGHCTIITPAFEGPGNTAGDIVPASNSTLIDPSGSHAIPAANQVEFQLSYGCGSTYPTGMSLYFEATILAPTSATVSMCASPGDITFSACPLRTST